MRSRFLRLLFLLVLWVASPLAGQVYSPEQVPNVFAQDSLQLLSDPAGYIPEEERAEINRELTQLRLTRGVEFAVVVIPSIGDEDLEDFTTALFRRWGIGSKTKNDGLLLLMSIEQRRLRFATGYGLEGALPDALLDRIRRNEMRSLMQDKQYGAAILAAIAAVNQALSEDGYQGEVRSAQSRRSHQINWQMIAFFYGLILLAAGYSAWSSLRDYEVRGKRSPQWLRAQLPYLPQKLVRYGLLLALLCLPLGMLYYLWAKQMEKRLVTLATRCPQCGAESMLLLSDTERLRYLPELAKLEEQLGSRRYQVYRCASCTHTELTSQDLGTHWQICEHCGGRTAEAVSSRLVNIPGKGRYQRTTIHCRHCGHDQHQDRRDTTDEDLTASALLLAGLMRRNRYHGDGGFGGGFGGGFSGGSFGGGSTGGGGASGGW